MPLRRLVFSLLAVFGLALAGPSAHAITMVEGVERPGAAYEVLKIEPPSAQSCQQACLEDPRCMAYSYVKPGFQGNKARCWLKESVTPSWSSECCVSGVKDYDVLAPVTALTVAPQTVPEPEPESGIADSAASDQTRAPETQNQTQTAAMGLDLCHKNGRDCGWPAATAYCQAEGFTRAVDFRVERNAPPTRTLGDGFLCDGKFCHRIAAVSCVREDTTPASTQP